MSFAWLKMQLSRTDPYMQQVLYWAINNMTGPSYMSSQRWQVSEITRDPSSNPSSQIKNMFYDYSKLWFYLSRNLHPASYKFDDSIFFISLENPSPESCPNNLDSVSEQWIRHLTNNKDSYFQYEVSYALIQIVTFICSMLWLCVC